MPLVSNLAWASCNSVVKVCCGETYLVGYLNSSVPFSIVQRVYAFYSTSGGQKISWKHLSLYMRALVLATQFLFILLGTFVVVNVRDCLCRYQLKCGWCVFYWERMLLGVETKMPWFYFRMKEKKTLDTVRRKLNPAEISEKRHTLCTVYLRSLSFHRDYLYMTFFVKLACLMCVCK